ncbi:MAG: rRNA maturation RNase YbeY [Pseudomonadota bacterium]|nr:rRNA maturation RNase YbeY [Pseudomonadota bacterium]
MSEMPLEPDSPDDNDHYASEDWYTDGGSHLEMLIDRIVWPADEIAAAADTLRAATDATCDMFDLPPLNVGGLFCNDRRIAGLNERFRGKEKPTNVLSFPSGESETDGEGRLAAGEIAIAFETVRSESVRDRKSLNDHLVHLWVHGLLHLMGHDHDEEAEAKAMESGEIAVLAKLGIADPYAGTVPHVDRAEAG